MKKIIFIFFLISISFNIFSQEKKTGFDLNKMFAGGSLVTGSGFEKPDGYDGNTLQLGLNPEIGYSLTKWFDVGVNFNSIYTNLKYQNGFTNVTRKSFNYGVGLFARLHIGKTFLIQAQPEYNWINFKISEDGNPDNKTSEIARSFLAGIGFTFRNVGQFNFFCVVMIDLQNELYSPYRTNAREVILITRIGMNFYFGRKKKSN